jgi:Ca-activated chloride channel homolog
MRTTRIAAVSGALLLMSGVVGCSGGDVDDDSAEGGHVSADSTQAPDVGRAGSDDDAGAPELDDYGVNPTVSTQDDNRSTFALDVDTGSYTIARDSLNEGYMPEAAAVRTEEFVNYFPQDYEAPEDGIGIHVDGTTVPFLDSRSQRVVRIGLQAAVVADEDRPPAVLTFVVDTSGSMGDAGKLEMVKGALGRLVDSLRPDDRVGVVTYSDDAEVRLEPTPISDQEPIRSTIDGLQPLASTNVEAGLRLGYEQARANFRDGDVNRVILLSDGVANVGDTDPGSIADDIQEAAGDGIQLVSVGVGMGDYSDVVMEQLADKGDGFYAYVDSMAEAERLFVNDLTGTLTVVAREAKVQVTFDPETVTSYRLLGFENRQVDDEDFRDDSVDGGEIGAGHTVTALYEVNLPEGGPASADSALATVDVRWLDPDSGDPLERTATLKAGDLVDTFDAAPARLRQDILVAAFAESLRDAPWSDRASLANVADNAERLVGALPDDEVVAEFVLITRSAAEFDL